MVKNRAKLVSAVFVTFAVSLLFAVPLPVASASNSIPVSGQIVILGATNVVAEPAGDSDNIIYNLNLYGVFVGDIAGVYTSESLWITHDAGTADSWTKAHGIDTISPATVDGKTGTLTFMLNGKTGVGGTWVILGGTGDLSDCHGHGTYTPSTASPYINYYEGEVHFDL